MKKPVVHRHVKTSAFITVATILLLTVAYFLLEYRAARVVQLLVKKQSKGQFQLKSEDIDISFLRRKIELNNAVIQRMDTSTKLATASIKFPLMTLRLSSWRSLVFQKTLLIDSIYLISPTIETALDSASENNDISFQAAKIFNTLQNVVQRLNIKSFRLKNGSLILHTFHSPSPFEIHGVDFTIRNFGNEENYISGIF